MVTKTGSVVELSTYAVICGSSVLGSNYRPYQEWSYSRCWSYECVVLYFHYHICLSSVHRDSCTILQYNVSAVDWLCQLFHVNTRCVYNSKQAVGICKYSTRLHLSTVLIIDYNSDIWCNSLNSSTCNMHNMIRVWKCLQPTQLFSRFACLLSLGI